MSTIMIWLCVAGLIAILFYLWRYIVMNSNELLFTFVTKMIEKVDKEAFWNEYGDQLMELLVEKLF